MSRPRIIAYNCCYIPPEWVAAHLMEPLQLLPAGGAVEGVSAGVCPFAHAFKQAACQRAGLAGVVVTTLCDQMRRISEWIELDTSTPVFLLNLPSTWQHVASFQLYVSELRRLGRWLVRLGGQGPEPHQLVQTIRQYHQDLDRQQWRDCGSGVRLALVGGELLESDLAILEMVRTCGGCIILDATDSGQRSMPARVEFRRLNWEDPLTVLAEGYFGIPHPFHRPNIDFYLWLKEHLAASGVQGILFHRHTWCDTWHVELERLRQWTHLPVLDLDSGGAGATARTQTRLQSFLEMLS